MAEPAASVRPRLPIASSWAEVDLAAVRHNLKAIRELVGPGCGVWAVVKTNAYGHGLVETARAAEQGGATGLAVATLPEGAHLRRAGLTCPVLVLRAGDPRGARQTVRLELTHTLCTTELARALSRASQALGKPARVHLKLDTGMGRLGLLPEEATPFARSLLHLPGLRPEGVFSHLASADAEDPGYTHVQLRRFLSMVDSLRAAGLDPGVRHLANSAATLRFPETRLDGVRTGLLTYGILPDAPSLPRVDLRPALTWKTRLAFVHRLPPGSRVSYGGTYLAKHQALVGVLPLGYADGYPRHASNRAYVLVRGKRCPVVGRVCMDHTMVDLTGLAEARAGEEVVLVGRQGDDCITANDVARWAGGVVHEVTTLIGDRVVRIYRNRTQAEQGSGAEE
jgi:alanine racemase